MTRLVARAARRPFGRRALGKPLLEHDQAGQLPRVNLSVKVTGLTPLTRSQAPGRGSDDAAIHLRRLSWASPGSRGSIHIDLESTDTRELILGMLAEPEFAEGPSAGIAVQAYLHDADEILPSG